MDRRAKETCPHPTRRLTLLFAVCLMGCGMLSIWQRDATSQESPDDPFCDMPMRFAGSTPVRIVNWTYEVACEIKMVPSSEHGGSCDTTKSWLPEDQPLAAGESVDLKAQPGLYTVRLNACDGTGTEVIAYAQRLELSGPVQIVVSNGGELYGPSVPWEYTIIRLPRFQGPSQAPVQSQPSTQSQPSSGSDMSHARALLGIRTRSDCQALVSNNSSMCDSNDCRAILGDNASMCDSNDCRAILGNNPSMCDSNDCRAVLGNNSSMCDSNDCRAILGNNSSMCASDTCRAILGNNSSMCGSHNHYSSNRGNCSTDSDCGGHGRCRNNRCNACSTDSDCSIGRCRSGACSGCSTDSDCRGHGRCRNNQCGGCSTDSDCQIGRCRHNQCGGCSTDSDCGEGRCRSNRCTNSP